MIQANKLTEADPADVNFYKDQCDPSRIGLTNQLDQQTRITRPTRSQTVTSSHQVAQVSSAHPIAPHPTQSQARSDSDNSSAATSKASTEENFQVSGRNYTPQRITIAGKEFCSLLDAKNVSSRAASGLVDVAFRTAGVNTQNLLYSKTHITEQRKR